jgi:UDP-N-acetylmuramoyl-tripeptide--D-alanyl-D-alanine ligase
MGAYKTGEIAKIAKLVKPNYAIITGIALQHLERFGSLKNIIKAKFELFDFVADVNKTIFNANDSNISKELKQRAVKNYNSYGVYNPASVRARDISFDKNGSSFTIIDENKSQSVKTKLFGYQNIYNILAAYSMAKKLGLERAYLVQKINLLKPFPHRFSLKLIDNSVLVDNTYNSNPQGFLEMLKTTKTLQGKKALVTPGIVELGNVEQKIHYQLAKEADGVFDKIILVGKNKRTISFQKALVKNPELEFIKDSRQSYNKKIEELIKQKFDWIFLENDLTENY